jgi:hypothetical protein
VLDDSWTPSSPARSWRSFRPEVSSERRSASLLQSLLYVGIPASQVHLIEFRSMLAYVLTIENFASFNRHVAEADPQHIGTTIFVGDYPSLGTQDIKLGSSGRTMAISMVRKIHVPSGSMSDQWKNGTSGGSMRAINRSAPRHRRRAPQKTGAQDCHPAVSRHFANRATGELSGHGAAKTLEQEELDPQIPALANAGA